MNSDTDFASIRQEYRMASLSEESADKNPVNQFQHWFHEAEKALLTEVNAMTLSTIRENNFPRSRIVLLKGIKHDQFIFYTNHNSHKGRDIADNPHVSLVFHWRELQRQVRIEGVAAQIPEEDSEAYYQSRPIESQIGAWASHQSEILDNRQTLEARYEAIKAKYENMTIPKPPHWGGYAVNPVYIEFWQGRASRLHDRICYQKLSNGEWLMQRLNP